MSSIVLNGDTSGSVTLSPPAVAGTQTVTLPAATGTVMVSGNMPAFSAYQSSAQTISSGSFTKVQFQTKEWDTANCFDNATNYRFTPNVAGYYQVNTEIHTNSSISLRAILVIYKNGSYGKWGSDTNAVNFSWSASALFYMNGSTDYLEVYFQQNSGTGQALSDQQPYVNYFQASLVRTA